jgi:hypothetical protein
MGRSEKLVIIHPQNLRGQVWGDIDCLYNAIRLSNRNVSFLSFFLFFLGRLEFELRALCLLVKCSTTRIALSVLLLL